VWQADHVSLQRLGCGTVEAASHKGAKQHHKIVKMSLDSTIYIHQEDCVLDSLCSLQDWNASSPRGKSDLGKKKKKRSKNKGHGSSLSISKSLTSGRIKLLLEQKLQSQLLLEKRQV
jgi:hypothetical protein